MAKKRFKEGFDRLGIVVFVVFAAGFLLVYLLAREPFILPPQGSPERVAVDADLAENCNPDNDGPFATLCRERVMAKYRWEFYRSYSSGFSMVFVGLLALAAMVIGYRTLRWVVAGFKQG